MYEKLVNHDNWREKNVVESPEVILQLHQHMGFYTLNNLLLLVRIGIIFRVPFPILIVEILSYAPHHPLRQRNRLHRRSTVRYVSTTPVKRGGPPASTTCHGCGRWRCVRHLKSAESRAYQADPNIHFLLSQR